MTHKYFILLSLPLIVLGGCISYNQQVSTTNPDTCYFFFGVGDADVDLLPATDKSEFSIESWNKERFMSFMDEHKQYCEGHKVTEMEEGFQVNDLFEGSDTVRVEITEIVGDNSSNQITAVVYGEGGYCIIAHGR